MKTIKMIDLLNKIATGEEVPQKIKVGNKIYNYETFNIGKGDNYFTAEWGEVKGYRINNDGTYYYLEIRDYNLNEPVEILEEEPYVEICGSWFTKSEYDEFLKDEEEKKIPGKLDIELNSNDENKVNYYRATNLECELAFKINEVIDYLDYLKSKGDE